MCLGLSVFRPAWACIFNRLLQLSCLSGGGKINLQWASELYVFHCIVTLAGGNIFLECTLYPFASPHHQVSKPLSQLHAAPHPLCLDPVITLRRHAMLPAVQVA